MFNEAIQRRFKRPDRGKKLSGLSGGVSMRYDYLRGAFSGSIGRMEDKADCRGHREV